MMRVYHASDTLKVGDTLVNGYKKNMDLAEPFVTALAVSHEMFMSVYLSAQYMRAALSHNDIRNMNTYAVKWAAEGIFEYVRRNAYSSLPCRLQCNYYCEKAEDSRCLYETDWGNEPEEDRLKIHLFEVELDDEEPCCLDMRWFDLAFDEILDLKSPKQIDRALEYAEKYFAGEKTDQYFMELLSDKPAVARKDISEYLRK